MRDPTDTDVRLLEEDGGLFLETARGLAAGGDLGDLLQRIVLYAARTADADGAFFERVHPVSREVEVVAATGDPAPEVGLRVPYPGSLAEEVIERARPEILTPDSLGRRILGGELGARSAGCSGLVLPLLSSGEPIGALILIRRESAPPFDPSDLPPLEPMAELAAISVRNALLREESEQRQRDLAESEQRFRLLVSAVGDYAIFMLDAEGAIVSWNEGAARISGYSEGEVLGRHISIFHTPEDVERGHSRKQLESARRDGVHEEEGWRLRRDGSRFRAHILITRLLDPSGALVGFAVVTRDLTERTTLEEARRLEAERYRAIYQNNPVIFFTTDSTGKIVDANRFGVEYLGFSRDELVGRSILDLVPSSDHGRFLEHLGRCIQQPDRSHQVELRKLRRDGSILWVREHARALDEAVGGTIVLHSCEDITDRVAADRALRQSESQFRQISDNLREVLWIAQPGLTSVDFVSPAFDELWGRPRTDLYDDPTAFLEPILPEDRPRVEEAIRRMEQSSQEVEFAIRLPDGGIRHISLRGFPAAGGDHAPGSLVGIAEDVTSRRRLETRRTFLVEAGRVLAASIDYEETLCNVADLAVEHIADWCFIELCEEGEIRRVAVSHADPEMSALAGEYLDRYPPAPDAPHGAPHVIRTGEPELLRDVGSSILEAVARDEEHYELLVRLGFGSAIAVPLRLEERILGAITLINGQGTKPFDEEDLHTAELLASRAAIAIEKAQLYREARNATRLRDDVLSIVSHDLRNPLNTIMMSAGFLSDTVPEEPPAFRKQLDIINRAAVQMNHLIGDLLDVAQIEAGSLKLDPQPQQVRLLIAEACQTLGPLAQRKGVDLACELPDDLPPVCADRERLQQVFSNLVGNAIKFTEEGGRVRVSAEAAGDCVRFSVEDTGSGIPEEDLPKLFDRFYQSMRTRKGGAGLGLAIVRGIVEAHNGVIRVESEVGKGTRFTFELPEVECAEDAGR